MGSETVETQHQPRPLHDWLKAELGVEHIPEINVHFDFGPHGGEELVGPELSKSIGNSQVIFIEAVGWSPEAHSLMQRVSDGVITPEEAQRMHKDTAPFFEYLQSQLHGTEKHISFLDLPHDDKELPQEVRAGNALFNFSEQLLTAKPPKLNMALKMYDDLLSRFGTHNVRRETHATQQFRAKVLEAFKANPELLKEKSVKVLVIYGGAHTSLQKRIREAYPDMKRSRTIHPAPLRFSYHSEVVRCFLFGIPVPAHVKRRALFEALAARCLGDEIPEAALKISPDGFERYQRAVGKALTPLLQEAFYRKFVVRGDALGARADLEKWLEKAGVPTDPRSKAFEDFLRKS